MKKHILLFALLAVFVSLIYKVAEATHSHITNADFLLSGTVAEERLPPGLLTSNATRTWTSEQTFSPWVTINGSTVGYSLVIKQDQNNPASGMLYLQSSVDQSASVSAYWIYTDNNSDGKPAFAVRNDKYIGMGIGSPRARLHVDSLAGTTEPILRVSTGSNSGTKLFEVTGSSSEFNVPVYFNQGVSAGAGLGLYLFSYASNTISATGNNLQDVYKLFITSTIITIAGNPYHFQSSAPANGILCYEGGRVFTCNDKNTGSGGGPSGLPLAEGASNYINASTAPTGGVMNITSGTIHNLNVDNLTVNGSSGVLSANTGPMQIKSAYGLTFEVAQDSVNVPSGNLHFLTTSYAELMYPRFVGTSTQATTIGYSTHPFNSGVMLDPVNTGSGPVNVGYFPKKVSPMYVAGTTPSITNLIDGSTGTNTGQRAYIIAFATSAKNALPQNLVYTSTVIYTISDAITSATGGAAETKTIMPTVGLCNILGSGNVNLWAKVSRDGSNTTSDPSDVPTVPIDIQLAFPIKN